MNYNKTALPEDSHSSLQVFLADLMHSGHNTKTCPLGLGFIATFAMAHFSGPIEIELFRQPEEFGDAVIQNPPDVIGFSYFLWNTDLTQRYAAEIIADTRKRRSSWVGRITPL
jgi:hypothetical protein